MLRRGGTGWDLRVWDLRVFHTARGGAGSVKDRLRSHRAAAACLAPASARTGRPCRDGLEGVRGTVKPGAFGHHRRPGKPFEVCFADGTCCNPGRDDLGTDFWLSRRPAMAAVTPTAGRG
jgi:hypothetical protein